MQAVDGGGAMSEPIQAQPGKYQPRSGYRLRLRDVRDHDAEYWAAFLTAMAMTVFGVAINQVGEWELARASIVVAFWVFVFLAVWTAPRLWRGD